MEDYIIIPEPSRGEQGPEGPMGDVTPEALAARDQAVAAAATIDTTIDTVMGNQFADKERAQLYTHLYNLNKSSGIVTVIGDSLTEGNTNGGHGWFEPWQTQFPNITFLNKGVGGNGTVDVINRLANITATNANLYILSIGTNDVRYQNPEKGATSATAFKTNIGTIITACQAAGGSVVCVELWPAFNYDYSSVLGYALRDKTAKLYSAAAKEYCGVNNIPYVEVFDDLKKALDFNNKSNFLVDYIHPNPHNGIKMYADEVLYGKRTSEHYGIAKSRAGDDVKYLYKLEILSAVSGNSLSLKRLVPDVATVSGTVWTTCTKNGHDDVTQILNVTNETYRLQNIGNDFPVIIIFGTAEPLQRLLQSNESESAIGMYNFYRSTDPNAMLNFNHPSWAQISGHDWGKSAPRRMLYNGEQSSSLTLESGWSIRNGINRITTNGDTVTVNSQFKKNSVWTIFEPIARMNPELAPIMQTIVPCIILQEAGSTFEIAFAIINTDGTILTPNRMTNTLYDCVILSCSYVHI